MPTKVPTPRGQVDRDVELDVTLFHTVMSIATGQWPDATVFAVT